MRAPAAVRLIACAVLQFAFAAESRVLINRNGGFLRPSKVQARVVPVGNRSAARDTAGGIVSIVETGAGSRFVNRVFGTNFSADHTGNGAAHRHGDAAH